MEDNDQDNTESAISEELSRFSSPSGSQSSSCTSISNPFYDGPTRPSEDGPLNSQDGAQHRNSLRNIIDVHKISKRHDSSSSQNPRQAGAGPSSEQTFRVATTTGAHSSKDEKIKSKVIIIWDLGYLLTCYGFLQFLQFAMTLATLITLVCAGSKEGGLLNLPLSWHLRLMLFVLVLTLLVTCVFLIGNVTSLITAFGFEWTFFDLVVYCLFAFFYLVGSSLVASAFDFYDKMRSDVSEETINQLVISVILGYICMVLNGLSAFLSYRKWKIQYRLYQRRKLIEEDEIDL